MKSLLEAFIREKKVGILKVLLRINQIALAVKTDVRKPDMIHVVVADGHDKSWCKVNANVVKKSAFKIPMRLKLSAVRETP